MEGDFARRVLRWQLTVCQQDASRCPKMVDKLSGTAASVLFVFSC